MSKQIRLLLSEEKFLSLEFMVRALSRYRGLKIVESETSLDKIMLRYPDSKPDVCLMNSIESCRVLVRAHADAKVLVLINNAEPDNGVRAFQAGAKGIFSRHGRFTDLYPAIRKIHAGDIWMSPEDLQEVVRYVGNRESTPFKDAAGKAILTVRQQGLVDLIAEGLTNREIAGRLHLSEHTVRNYLFKIFNKLGTSNRLELALYAINRRDTDEKVLAVSAKSL